MGKRRKKQSGRAADLPSNPPTTSELEEIIRRIREINPTGRGLSPSARKQRYREKSALQSELVRHCYVGFPINRLLSTGGKAELPNGFSFDMGEGERFHESPEVTDRWIEALPFRDAPTEYIMFKPLQKVSEQERPSLVVMFVTPDQLSALVTLAGFRTGSTTTSVSPWGAACQSMLFAHAEAERERPAGVIGFFDISQRRKVARDLLTYTMPYRLFLEMEGSVEESFLRTHAWLELKERQQA